MFSKKKKEETFDFIDFYIFFLSHFISALIFIIFSMLWSSASYSHSTTSQSSNPVFPPVHFFSMVCSLTSARSSYSSSHVSLPHFSPSFSILFWPLCPQLNPFPPSTLAIWPHFWKTTWPCQGLWPLIPKELWSKSHNSLCISHLFCLLSVPHSCICHLITRLF